MPGLTIAGAWLTAHKPDDNARCYNGTMPVQQLVVDRSGFAPQLGAVVREARSLVGWSQRELADRARTSHTSIWRIETCRGDLDLLVVERVLAALGLRATLSVDDRTLLDRRRQADGVHARLNGYIGRWLGRVAWTVATEVMIGDEVPRGWIDTLAFRSADGSLLVEETKTELDDLGRIQRSLAFYEREAMTAAAKLGWAPRRVAALVVALDTAAVARRLSDVRDAAQLAFPATVGGTLEWLRSPAAPPPSGWTLAVADPARRGSAWLLPSALASRRRPAYRDYRDAATQLLRG